MVQPWVFFYNLYIIDASSREIRASTSAFSISFIGSVVEN